jgi:hypothetical protein
MLGSILEKMGKEPSEDLRFTVMIKKGDERCSVTTGLIVFVFHFSFLHSVTLTLLLPQQLIWVSMEVLIYQFDRIEWYKMNKTRQTPVS